MRRATALLQAVALVAALTAVACARPAAAELRPDTLWLELGGGGDSLQRALVAAGVPMASPEAGPNAAEVPREAPPEPPGQGAGPDHFVVLLERGETLIHLAKKHLGNGNRFREILAANGWTEAEARRLPAGQPVKVPLTGPAVR
ncbi:MAG: hypothetical protein KF830_02150 [Planctomycetes bacterium]|nr:hypothetical protein [Planctomycetota bacterium]